MFEKMRSDILLGLSMWAVIMLMSSCVVSTYRNNVSMQTYSDHIVIRSHLGGYLQDEINFLADIMKSGKSIRIEGSCHSACTILLSYDKTCVTPGSFFGFHAASYADGRMHLGGTLMLMKFYPPPILAVFINSGASLDNKILRVITGATVIRLLDNACTD